MSSYLSKRFFSLALLVPLLSNPVIAYAGQQDTTAEQQQALPEFETRWVQLQPEVMSTIQNTSVNAHEAVQELLTYAPEMVAPYDIALAAVDAVLEYHTKNSMPSCAEIIRAYKQALVAGTVVIPQDQEDMYVTRSLRERCFPGIRTRLLRANRICALELGANNATFNNLTVAGNQTITGNLTVNGTINGGNNGPNGPIDPSDLCINGALNLPCDLNVGGDLTVSGTINGTINPTNLCVDGALNVPCNLNVDGNQTITGTLTVNNTTTINGNEVINGDLIVNGTINGTINPASLCSGGVATFPCNLQFNSANNTLNSVGSSAEAVLNLIRGTIAPNLSIRLLPLPISIVNDPVILAGAGFTVTPGLPFVDISGLLTIGAGTVVGTIDVAFAPGVQFTDRPSITLGTESGPGGLAQLFDYRVSNVSATGFSIEIVNILGIPLSPLPTLTAGNINFIAIAPTVGT